MASDRNEAPHRGPSFLDTVTLRDVLATAGFACLLATMLLYSAAAMPFQRFAALPDLVEAFGTTPRAAAALGAAAAIASVLPAMRVKKALGSRTAMALGAVVYLAGNLWFCLMALDVLPPSGPSAAGILIGAGDVAQCLAWGRILAVYDLRRAIVVVAVSAVGAALLGWAQLAMPETGAVALFMGCSLACTALPFLLARTGRDRPPVRLPARPDGGASAVRTFLDVAFVPSIGLVLFAAFMSLRGEEFFDDYPQYVAIQVIVALFLLLIVLLPLRRPLLQGVYRGFVPILAAVMLAVNYMDEAVGGGSSLEVSLVMVLYTAAALLALATLVGMAHAAEFPADLVSSLTVGTFGLVTAIVQVAGARIGIDRAATHDIVVVSSALYAAGMIAFTIVRGLGPRDDDLARGVPAVQDGPVAPAQAAAVPHRADRGFGALSPTLEGRCDRLVADYGLTGREDEILRHLALGRSSSYIADELLISPNTVRTHVHNIYRKLGVATRDDILRLVWEG